jgi:two-component system sensor histidine kinase BaeS
MMSLRLRFILSHVLPILIVIPLVGIFLIYGVETKILIPELTKDLEVEAKLVNNFIMQEDDFQLDRAHAQAFIDEISPVLSSRMMLFDRDGHLLASSDPGDETRIGEIFTNLPLQNAMTGVVTTQQMYSRNLDAEIADMWNPVIGPQGQIIGVFRLSHQLATILEEFIQVRYTIGAILLAGLILGIVLGWILAAGLSNPINQVIRETRNLALGLEPKLLPVHGSTETRMLLRTFNLMVERLESSEQSRRRLLANLVHELGRPLGAMGSAVQSLLGGAEKDKELQHELLSGMNVQIVGLRRLLDDLALLHELVVGEIDLELQNVDMNLWFPQMLSTWHQAAQAKGIHWIYSQDERLPMMNVDPDRLDQALGNLLSNAIKFTPEGGEINIKTGIEDHSLFIYVHDTGSGIQEDELSKIFMPFYRGSQAQRFPQGMGLGLSIASDIVFAHNGNLEVQSTPGKGSTFKIHLPLNSDFPSISSPE